LANKPKKQFSNWQISLEVNMSTYATKQEFNLNDYEDLGGRIKFLIVRPIAMKNYYLRPVARCTEGH